VCSGIEAATVAWHPLGWTAAAYSEIEKFPSQVLAHHYPDVPNVGDMTKFKEWNLGPIDLLVGGTPCQSFSVAGLRKGLDDPRGNLMLTFLAIADQHRPRWLVWENVPGVLSSNGGKDFGTFLGALGELGYGFAYRILDAQFFGVAQRRRRVFVVGYLGDWRAAAAVLFERHSLSGDSAPSREKRKEVTECAGDGARVSGLCARTGLSNSVQDAQQGHLLPIALQDITAREKAQNGKGWNDDGSAYTVDTHATQGVAQPIAYNIAPGKGALKDDIHVTTADATKTLDASGSNPAMHQGGAAILQPIAFAQNQRNEVRIMAQAGALAAEPGMKQQTYIAQPISFSGQMSEPQTNVDMTQTLQARNPMAVAVGTDLYNGAITGEVAATMGTPGSSVNASWPTVMQQVGAFKPGQSAQAHSIGYENEMAPTLEAGSGGNNKPAVHHGMAVRRLTPVECERLQGFGDNYTNIKDKCPDGPRYKALGNSMAVPVMAWIGKRIQEVEQMQCKPNK
jgi:DNA (cytosine-5)-methyltransferase 1